MPTLDLPVGVSSDDCFRRKSSQSPNFSLTVDLFTGDANGSTNRLLGGGMRFTNVTIPKGATIETAYITLTAAVGASGTTCNSKIRGEAADNAATFSTEADFDGRSLTSAVVNWNNIGAWAADTEYNSPEIKTIIQEIVNRAGWSSGNALVIFWEDFDGNSDAAAYRRAYGYDSSPSNAPKLHIEYAAATEKTSSDTGSGADTYVSLETPGAKTSSDTGSGLEGTPLPSASLAGSESGAGVEVLVARLLVAFDTGSDIEVAQLVGLLRELFASELGEGLDSLVAKIEMPTKGGGMKLWT